jgi:hypothetical protein
MSTPSPSEQVTNEISTIQTKIGWMQDSARLKAVLDAVEDLQTNVNNMPQRISKLRTNGYVFEKTLENQATALVRQWSEIHPALVTQINIQSSALQGSLRAIELIMTQLNGMGANPVAQRSLIASINSDLDMLEDKVRSAEATVNGMYDAFNQQTNIFKHHLDDLDYLFIQLAEARFTLLPTEAGLRAVKAVWCKEARERDDDPEGVFYLTDQRLLFEQKEEVATKKILFITTAKQKVQELKWEIPVALIDDIKASKQGMLKNEDHLEISFKEGAAHQSIHMHIWQDNIEWVHLLNRAKNREFDADRAVAIDQAEVAKVKTAPSKCPSCGANFDQVILRGQDSIKCEFCGFMVRL